MAQHPMPVLTYISFIVYLLFLTLLIIALSLSTLRIRSLLHANPRSVTLLLPITLNKQFLFANWIFISLHPFLTTVVVGGFSYLMVRRLEKVRIFGLTGGTGVGKTTLLGLLGRQLKQMHVVDCEKIMDEQMKKDKTGYRLVKKMFGNRSDQFLDLQTEQIQKSKLIDLLYEHRQTLNTFYQKIEWVMLPKILSQVISHILNRHNIILLHAPYISHSRILKYFCYPIVVLTCSPRLQVERARIRWGCTEAEARARLGKEMGVGECMECSQVTVDNGDTQQRLLSNFLGEINPYLRQNMHHAHAHKK